MLSYSAFPTQLLVFVETPVKITKKLTKQVVAEGQPAKLSCKLSKPGQVVTWYKNGTKLSAKNYYQTSDGTEYVLSIPECKLDDSAEYTIKAGDIESSAQLIVNGENMNIERLLS